LQSGTPTLAPTPAPPTESKIPEIITEQSRQIDLDKEVIDALTHQLENKDKQIEDLRKVATLKIDEIETKIETISKQPAPPPVEQPAKLNVFERLHRNVSTKNGDLGEVGRTIRKKKTLQHPHRHENN